VDGIRTILACPHPGDLPFPHTRQVQNRAIGALTAVSRPSTVMADITARRRQPGRSSISRP